MDEKIKLFNGGSKTKFLEEIPVLNSVGNLSDSTYENKDKYLKRKQIRDYFTSRVNGE